MNAYPIHRSTYAPTKQRDSMMHSRPRMSLLASVLALAGLGGGHPYTLSARLTSGPRGRRNGGTGRTATKPKHARTCHHRKRAKAQRRRARLRQ